MGLGILAGTAALAEGPSAAQVARLAPVEAGIAHEFSAPLEGKEVVFKKEPAYAGKHVYRGALPSSASPNFMGFAWDKDARKLYLDLNRNLDLTDDPSGVYTAGDYYGGQRFSNIHVESGNGPVACRYVFDLTLYILSHAVFGKMTVRSGWHGAVQLDGKTYQLTVVDDLDGVFDGGDVMLLDEESSSPIPKEERLRALNLPEQIVLGDATYGLVYALEPGEGNPALMVTFSSISGAKGTVDLKARHVLCAMLENAAAEAASQRPGSRQFTFLYRPPPNIGLRAGAYSVDWVNLDAGPSGIFTGSSETKLMVNADRAVSLSVGGEPLKSTVRVKRAGKSLSLDYALVDAAGNEFRARARYGPYARDPGPRFIVYKDGRAIGTGMFEYG
jgi:hypothetical protein